MGFHAPKGNKFAVGAHGGRRPSVKEEQAHLDAWQQPQNIQDLKTRVESGVFSGWDMYQYQALVLRNDKIMAKWGDKILADLHDIRGKDGEKFEGALMVPAPVAIYDTESPLEAPRGAADDIPASGGN